MWLDRLSGHSTPSATPPHSRSFSPASRRTSHLAPQAAAQRPGFNPRSSSLSLVSNDSTTSLLGNARKVNGSGLKQSATVPDYPEPLEVLEKLLGSETQTTDGSNNGQNEDTVQETGNSEDEFDFEGLSLSEFLNAGISENSDSLVYKSQTVDECKYTHVEALILFSCFCYR